MKYWATSAVRAVSVPAIPSRAGVTGLIVVIAEGVVTGAIAETGETGVAIVVRGSTVVRARNKAARVLSPLPTRGAAARRSFRLWHRRAAVARVAAARSRNRDFQGRRIERHVDAQEG